MSITLKIALIIITMIYLYLIISSVNKRKMQSSMSIFWIITGFLLIVAIAIPNLIENISSFLGFEKASNMIFCLTIFIAFYLIFNLTMLLAKQTNRNTSLIQEVSILKRKIAKMEEKINERENASND